MPLDNDQMSEIRRLLEMKRQTLTDEAEAEASKHSTNCEPFTLSDLPLLQPLLAHC